MKEEDRAKTERRRREGSETRESDEPISANKMPSFSSNCCTIFPLYTTNASSQLASFPPCPRLVERRESKSQKTATHEGSTTPEYPQALYPSPEVARAGEHMMT